MTPLEFFKCLADETRLRSVLLIHQESELCVCELMVALNESQPKISRHLAHLRQCNLLVDRRDSKWVYYRLNPDLPSWISRLIAVTANENQLFIAEDYQRLLAMSNRPNTKGCCQ